MVFRSSKKDLFFLIDKPTFRLISFLFLFTFFSYIFMSNKELVEQASIKSTVTIDKPPGYLNEKDGSSYHSKASKNAIGDDEDVESLQHGTQRGLSARHIQMISLGGSIG
jgi:hypothetical protein